MDIYSLPPMPVNWDAIGIAYITVACAWTFIVVAGAVFLVANKTNPVLRVRGLGLSLTAIFFLHAYWILAQLVYPIGASMPVLVAYDVQFFVMGIWFPLGIALFHASNSRFLYVAKMQRQFVTAQAPTSPGGGATPIARDRDGVAVRLRRGAAAHLQCALCRLRNLDYPTRVLIYISIGIFFQVLLTVGMWLACRKYHPRFGIEGTDVHGATVFEQIVDMGRGWEWWPSVLWQVVWTWIVAPVLVWRAWEIRDTLGWRVQTIGCCLASLHSVPMWLVATYHPDFAPINKYFAPSQWLHLSTMSFEVFAVFVPCYLVVQDRIRSAAARKNSRPGSVRSQGTGWSCDTYAAEHHGGVHADVLAMLKEDVAATDEATGSSATMSSNRLLSMKALDIQLERDPAPLQTFSALRDFSGENIAFLSSVRDWKRSLGPLSPGGNLLTSSPSICAVAFHRAVAIFADFVSPKYAEFPLNLSSNDVKQLQTMFGPAAQRHVAALGGVRNQVAPFDGSNGRGSSSDLDGSDVEKGLQGVESPDTLVVDHHDDDIPDAFGAAVFDPVVDHVKQLVLTNTWPKFISEGRTSSARGSVDTSRSERSDGKMGMVRVMSNYIDSIF